MGRGYTDAEREEIIRLYQIHGSISGVARARGTISARSSITAVIDRWKAENAKPSPVAPTPPTEVPQAKPSEKPRPPLGLSMPDRLPMPTPKGRRTYLVTAAQNNTAIHEGFWENLLALADHDAARIIVGGFIYRKDAFGQQAQEVTHKKDKEKGAEWDKRILPYLLTERSKLADGLFWCGEMNILPTAERPLSGLANYTGVDSAIFPSTKFAMESIATSKHEPAKHNYTSGSLTHPNYLQRKAGLKAEFHHVIGALIVEVDEDETWFVRQINAAADGSFYDLDRRVASGRVTTGHAVEGINWGDIHEAQLEDWIKELSWGKENSIIDTLRPRYQFCHDTLDFRSRSHHETKDPHEMFRKWVTNKESVQAELMGTVNFLKMAERQFCQTVVVESNHDNAYLRWVKEASHKTDHPNAIFLLESQLASLKAIAANDNQFHLFGWAIGQLGYTGSAIFLDEDDSFLMCGSIECAMHGHLGMNGARGSGAGFTKMGRKLNIGHMHSAAIVDGVYIAGVWGNLDMGYNKGPSSWSHSMIVTYPNGKRTIVTLRDRKWRADQPGFLKEAA